MDIEALYQEAKTALAAKDYDRAADLLRQILLQDHDYKDTSRLLAHTIKLKRRRWYNDPRVWGVVSILVVAALLVWVVPRLSIPGSVLVEQPAVSAALPQEPTTTQTQIAAQVPTAVSTPSPTPLPLVWKRVSIGLEFPRDQVTAIVGDPNDPDVFYVGTQTSGVYKSINGGLSWLPSHDGLNRAFITGLLMDPNNSAIIYASVDIGGIFKTTDGAKSWFPINSRIELPGFEDFSQVVMDTEDSQHLYFTQRQKLYQSIDGGFSWEMIVVPDCLWDIKNLAIHPGDGNTIYITGNKKGPEEGIICENGIFKSTDAGENWSLLAMEPALNAIEFNSGSLFIDPRNANFLYISAWNNDKPYSPLELYGSFDGGQTWQYLNRKNCNVMFFDREYENFTYCGSEQGEIWVSQNSGRNWSMMQTTQNTGNINALISLQSQKLLAGGWGFYVSDDTGKSLVPHNSGFGSGNTNLIFSKTFDANLFIEDNDQQIYFSQDHGSNWQIWEGLRSTIINDYIEDALPFTNQAGQVLYRIGTDGWQTYYTKDEGLTWYICGLPSGFDSFFYSDAKSSLAIDPRDDEKIFLATYGQGVLVSSTRCKTWYRAPKAGLGSLFVNSLAIDANNPDTMYAGTDGGASISTDAGKSWTEINDGLLGATVVYSIVVDDDSNVYASTPYGIFKLESK